MENASVITEGLSYALIGMGVVFLGLIFLFIFMKVFVYFFVTSGSKKSIKTGGLIIRDVSGNAPMSGEILAAISLAIHQSREEFHDLEETIITMNRITKPYSPWSSKIHSIRKPAR